VTVAGALDGGSASPLLRGVPSVIPSVFASIFGGGGGGIGLSFGGSLPWVKYSCDPRSKWYDCEW